MKTIQILIRDDMLRAVDRVTRKQKINRSALIRTALDGYLKQLRTKELEERDRRGYAKYPPIEFAVWDKVRSWPED